MAQQFERFEKAFKVLQFADAPHPIAIALGLLSPALALVAVYISWSSFSFSQASLEIGQRAYLSVRVSSFSLVQQFVAPELPWNTLEELKAVLAFRAEERVISTRMSCPLELTLGVSLTNSGNTPATVEDATATIELIKMMKGPFYLGPKTLLDNPPTVHDSKLGTPDVLQRETVALDGRVLVQAATFENCNELLKEKIDQISSKRSGPSDVRARVAVAYHDVFRKKHKVFQCAEVVIGSTEMRPCEAP
jgi:hypothetical protein